MILSPITKSVIITIIGYIISAVLAYFVIYPAFGIAIILSTALYLGVIFTVIAFVSNLISIKIIEMIENYKGE